MPSLRHMPRLGAKDCRRETLYVQMSGFSTSGAKHGGMALSEAKRLNGQAPEKWSSMKYGFRTGRRTHSSEKIAPSKPGIKHMIG